MYSGRADGKESGKGNGHMADVENEKKKAYLRQYRDAVRQMKRAEERINEMRITKMYPSPLMPDGMPHAHEPSDLSGYAAMLDREERKYLKYRYQRIRLCKEITDKIERLESEDEKDVLTYRYIKFMKWEDICRKMGRSWQQVHRIHAKSLKNFKM